MGDIFSGDMSFTDTGLDPKAEAQLRLARSGIRRGQVFRHYKGGIYSVVSTSIMEDTLVPLVTYKSNARETEWTRTLEVFTSRAPSGAKRFTRLAD